MAAVPIMPSLWLSILTEHNWEVGHFEAIHGPVKAARAARVSKRFSMEEMAAGVCQTVSHLCTIFAAR